MSTQIVHIFRKWSVFVVELVFRPFRAVGFGIIPIMGLHPMLIYYALSELREMGKNKIYESNFASNNLAIKYHNILCLNNNGLLSLTIT